ncbi:VanZ family protein [Paenibacillus lupini]|uniref:VanZ family protein n=1 Tax=Paenibacillus lupini TaxID=1450204 RepID=UPI0014228ED4|nr:VanZ family protein [Paenibacillus lupini]NIK22691.1 glycopeptide antibiotics resistance protein [Paenibacillus lupini]
MDLITVSSVLLKWAFVALIGCVGVIMLLGGSYFIYKKVFRGKRNMSKKHWLMLGLLVAWFLVVLGLTTISRGANYTGDVNFHLFSGYVNAWNKWSVSELQLVLFNMLMFVPLGFLLPLLLRRAETFWLTFLVTLLTTGGIEIIQLVTGKGIFELDDIFHNLIGGLAGYFLVMAILVCIRQKRFAIQSVLRGIMIPALFGALIGSAMIMYQAKEFGNMPILPAMKQDMDAVTVENKLLLHRDTDTASVYRNIYANNMQRGRDIAEQLSRKFAVNFSDTIRREGDDNRIFMGKASDSQQADLYYQYKDGGWHFSTENEGGSLSEHQAATLRAEMEQWYSQNSLAPDNAVFSIQDNNFLRWDAKEPEDLAHKENDFVSGIIMVQFAKDGTLSDLFNQTIWNKFDRKLELISSKQAFEQVQAGNFYMYAPFHKGDKLVVNEYALTYVYDTKGYYQPVYEFKGYINNNDHKWSCQIPARR